MSRSPLHRLYCVCGSKLEAQSTPPDAATEIVDWWLGRHRGTGHSLTDARTARRARAKRDVPTPRETAEVSPLPPPSLGAPDASPTGGSR